MNTHFKYLFIFLLASATLFAQHNGRYVKRYNLFHKYILGHYKDHKKTGEWVEWNRDGTIRTIQYFYNGLPDGPYINNLSNISGFYKEGKRDSVWIQRLNNGMDSMVTYKNDMPNGETWTKRENSGKLSWGYFKNGVRDSVYSCLMNNGMRLEGKYKMGKKTGKWITSSTYSKTKEEYYENDSLVKRVSLCGTSSVTCTCKEEVFKNGKVVREHNFQYYGNCNKKSEEFFVNPTGMSGMNLRDSLWTEWSTGGKITHMTWWKNGKKNGLESKYTSDGVLFENTTYKNDVKDGLTEEFYPNGKKRNTGNYENGRKEGEWTAYYESGYIQQWHYVHDTVNGIVAEWYPNGQKKTEMNYNMGILDGKYTAWDVNGKVIASRTYKKSEQKYLPDPLPRNGQIETGGETKKDPDSNEPFLVVDVMPEFPGGQAEMYKYISSNIIYPMIEREEGIQGKVYISFVVDKEGKVTDVRIVKGVAGGPGLDKEAERVFKMMPDWKPGKMNGQNVAVKMTIPVKFQLQ